MKKVFFILSIAVLTTLSSCSYRKSDTSVFDDCPIVGEVNANGLTTVYFNRIKDTITLPISQFISEFSIIELESDVDAFVHSKSPVRITDNYIGIGMNSNQRSYLLFDRQGTYIGTSVRRGQGPNEMTIGTYDSFIDDKTGNVFAVPFASASKIVVNDKYGSPIRTIPLAMQNVPKMKFEVDMEKQIITGFAMPFNSTPMIIWQQNFDGNLIQSIPTPPDMVLTADYSHDIMHSQNTVDMDYDLVRMDNKQDSLYHYNTTTNTITPVFTTRFPEDIFIPHSYIELPDYYILILWQRASATMDDNGISYSPASFGPFSIIIDKKTLKGCFVKLSIDMLGGIEVSGALLFSRGYYTKSFEPLELQDQIAPIIAHKEALEPSVRKRLEHLNAIDDNANNILFIAKVRQSDDPEGVTDHSSDPNAPRKVYERKTPPVQENLKNNLPPPPPGMSDKVRDPTSGKMIDAPKQGASFPGGAEALYKFLKDNSKYPILPFDKISRRMEERDKMQGLVTVTYDMDARGRISNAKISKHVDEAHDAEALRLIQLMPQWNPSLDHNGEPMGGKGSLYFAFIMQ